MCLDMIQNLARTRDLVEPEPRRMPSPERERLIRAIARDSGTPIIELLRSSAPVLREHAIAGCTDSARRDTGPEPYPEDQT
jgi:hypothetical protein